MVIGAGSVFITELATGGSFGLAGLDADSGQELWRASVGSVDSTVQRYQADGENIIAALEGGPAGGQLRLTGRLPITGRLRWTTPYLPLGEAGLPSTAIAAAGHRVFQASSSGVLTAIDARTGDTSWTAPFPSPGALFPPRLTADHNAVAVRHGDQLSVFHAATGAPLWSTRLNSGADPETTPAIGANRILVPRSSSPCMPPSGGG